MNPFFTFIELIKSFFVRILFITKNTESTAARKGALWISAARIMVTATNRLFFLFFPPLSLFAALCSVDVARKSRELVDGYLDELGSKPDTTLQMVSDYFEKTAQNGGGGGVDSAHFVSSLYATRNGRTSMEDRHIIIPDLNKALNLNVRDFPPFHPVVLKLILFLG